MPSRSSTTPSPGTMARSAATISARRPRMAGSRGGICMPRSLRQMKGRRKPMASAAWICGRERALALTRLEARVGLVDDVDAALAAHDAAVLVARLHRLQRMADLHGTSQQKAPAEPGKFRK